MTAPLYNDGRIAEIAVGPIPPSSTEPLMNISRRDFLRVTAATAATTFIRPIDVFARPAPMHILVLGGTGFIGPYQVRYALERGHKVTIFNRGRTNPNLFGGDVEQLIGDRSNNLESLRNRKFDAVIDNSATNPEWVKLSAQLLKDAAGQYLFISTRSAYYDTSAVPMTAAAPLYSRENTRVEPGRPLPYGLSKALAEGEARAAFGDRTTIVRPGLIIGPGDETDRFTYWPVKIDRGGEILAPGDGTDRVQIIDVRDLSEWVIRLVENRHYGVFNAVGPKTGPQFKDWLATMQRAVGGNATFTWVDTDWLLEKGVRPYADIPVWQPARGRTRGFAQFDLTPEIERGLTFRPLEVTARETLAWWKSLPAERQVLKAGMKPEREAELLRMCRAISRGR